MGELIALTDEMVARFTLSDAQLIGIVWCEGGRDLQIQLLTGDGRAATLKCTWVSGVRIDLRFEARSGGHALSWECRFGRCGTRWRMVFEFPPQGGIEFECNEAWLEYHRAD